ncbi:MAG: hypothetical protein ACSHX8_02695 [Opitutaceae bacterium]
MNKITMKHSVKISLCAIAMAPIILVAGEEEDARWEVGVGVSTRIVGKTKFDGHIGRDSFESAINVGPSIDSISAAGPDDPDRVYDNGYVNRSSITDALGLTTFWNYHDASSQIDTGAGTISFNQNLGTSTNVVGFSELGGRSKKRPDDNLAPYFELARVKKHDEHKHIEYGLIATFTWLSTDVDRDPTALSSADFETFNVDLVDTYDLNGVIPPPANNLGSYLPGGDHPVLEFVPSGRDISEISTGSPETAWGLVSDDVDIDVQSLSIGGLYRRLQVKDADENGNVTFGRFSGQIEGGITFNRIDLDWDRNASIVTNSAVLASESSSDSEVDFKLGAYGAVGVRYRADDEGKSHFAFKARYDYLGKERLGKSDWGTEINLNSWSFNLTYARTF